MRGLFSVLVLACLGLGRAQGQLKLTSVFGDHMVLQCGMDVAIWGWAKPNEEVVVILDGQVKVKTKSGEQGRWMAKLPPQPAGGPHELVIAAGNEKIRFTDVLFGEVWLCSGQSNMAWALKLTQNAPKEISEANYPQIRIFVVGQAATLKPQNDCKGQWLICNPETVADFSAVAYFFGREIHTSLKVPVGLIGSYWGGTPAEAWMDMETLKTEPDFEPIVKRFPHHLLDPETFAKAQAEHNQAMAEWWKKAVLTDLGNKREEWSKPDFNDSDWETMELPQPWELAKPQMFGTDGAVWFRKVVRLPNSWAGKDLVLHLGTINDQDTTYFNGEQVGSTQEAKFVRRYKVSGQLVKAGDNLIAVRVFNRWGAGGFVGVPSQMFLELAGGSEKLPLAGAWKFKVEFARSQSELPPQPKPLFTHQTPTVLFNGMINPVIPYTIRGVIWYQGESNVYRAFQYRKLFPALISSWRKLWGQGDFPFLFVQLANFQPDKVAPQTKGMWAELREAQLLTFKTVPNTGMAVTIDIGNPNDIHPRNKRDVGKRLALAALAIAYGQKVVHSGPIYRSMRIEGDKIRLFFDHVGSGLVAKGDKLVGFTIAGADRKFVDAKAKIEGDTVLVWSEEVSEPVAVRYGWADNPNCNLYNKEGLPASPFRTDDWEGLTDKNR